MNKKAQRGVTLLELLVVLAISAILLLVALPSFKSLLAKQRFDADIEAAMIAMKYARLEASRRQDFIYVHRDGNDGENEFTIAEAATVGGAETILKIVKTQLDDSVGGEDSFYFKPNGTISGANTRVFKFCRESGENGRQIEILLSGRIRLFSIASANCP
ncbi:type IV fimbrial biogenesis protein FimT [Sinobacterium caligoides]|uniref:Type II secretion system protein H n=2 Tax=Sinobacterium caligoides TaxID=933926 RepID=A0A3N2D4M1_9GAMM|nr:type IV fimbrial biogenesis protein FimT [Sinobacterium caligoides]